MLRGLYTASTALVSKTKALDVTSNNLANINTDGYKRDYVTYESFEDVLISKYNGQYANNEFASKSIDVKENDGVYTLETLSGYFQVQTNDELSHNKSVKFMKNEEGYLSTFYLNGVGEVHEGIGYKVQGQNGDVYIGDEDFEVDDTGQVLVGGKVVDNLLHSYNNNVIGTINGGTKVKRIITDYEQGTLKPTENQLDFALEGKGFYTVESPVGTRYTRDGNFKLNGDYELVTNEGYNVMGFDGPIILEDGSINVNLFGELTVDGEIVDKFQIVNPENVHDMHKEGDGLYYMDEEMIDMKFEGNVRQGFIEGSNVNSIQEMIEVMQLYRNYESSQKLVTTYDSTLEKVINEVGRV